LPHANLTVRRHDIVAEALPESGRFDLVHARWLLHWIAQPRKALARMVAALRPGGWLLAEEPDWVTLFHACPSEIVSKVATLLWGTESAIVDAEYGRHLFDDMRALGLLEMESSGRIEMVRGGTPLATHMGLSMAKSAAPFVESGAIRAEDLEEALARLNDPAFATMSAITMAVWGRRPPGGSEQRK
jgi:SAM-dependent methyltransferase